MEEMTVTARDLAFKRLYEALYLENGKSDKLFDAVDAACPFIGEINREIKDNERKNK